MRKLFLCSAVLVAACSDGSTSPRVASLSVAVPTPNIPVGQTVTLTAQTVSNRGAPLAQQTVAWNSLDPQVATVNASGVVTAVTPGVATITAAAGGRTAKADVYVVAGSVNCSATAPTVPAVGEVRLLTGAERSAICVPAVAAGSEYVLIAFNASAEPKARVPFAAAGERVAPVIGGPTPSLAGSGAAFSVAASRPLVLGDAAPLASAGAQSLTPDTRFHLALRARERRQLQGRMAGAARVMAARGVTPNLSVAPTTGATAAAPVPSAVPSLAKIPATKGARVRINTQAGNACESPDYRVGLVAAVGKRSIIVTDTLNPAGGFADVDYERFAAVFDTLVYPVDTRYFGEPSDIDGNQRSVIFFTRAVNELTPAGSESYVGGFFFGRDLFPITPDRARGLEGCAGSNEAELFYMLVPDPAGIVNGNKRARDFVAGVTTGVLAHEFQHLINESRRLHTNNAPSFEEVWLNEGLSHIAEELMFYAVTKIEPGANVDVTRLRASQATINAFNEYQGSNFARLRAYLQNPEGNSPYASDDSLATRGATWQFLRYAADRTDGDETAIFKALVNSKVSGFQNLNAVFGGNALNLARDWSVAQYTDDSNIGQNLRTSYQFPSWNYRSIYAAFRDEAGNSRPFPLRVVPLPSTGGAVETTLVGGGTIYLRFGAAPATTATVRLSSSGTAVPEPVQLVLVRTR